MTDSAKNASGADNRRRPRFPCNIAGTVVIDRVEHPMRIRDVSALGCCFSGEMTLDKGDEIVCRLRGISVVATVAWATPPLVGANFHREIDLKQVLRDANDRPAFLNRRLAGAMALPTDKP